MTRHVTVIRVPDVVDMRMWPTERGMTIRVRGCYDQTNQPAELSIVSIKAARAFIARLATYCDAIEEVCGDDGE